MVLLTMWRHGLRDPMNEVHLWSDGRMEHVRAQHVKHVFQETLEQDREP